ncbi:MULTISPECIES: beta-ketoacyl synthase [unclassified Streptomyces]|uniref:beta-ketoacyl-[acyl-carrier-protein] synthase family protein n=1 Tax=Streptomyces TaxID=1883 RepID=UPI001B36D8F8|nr:MULTISPECIES: beta-ketoacyl-[acyl-carrier-protein] synthase family protein [unclassified Streptomyces]MBQ0912984.1 beta-ketoacyl-[acyl-carrier-protein] synthase family protein [Streptomyces sp. RM99]MBU8553632.1 beta-ketoacyl-[acyl-carrier-protein] synthase family protein [Streptomyces sp. Osf17]MBU8560427.1 beta-ketoacyl-[acyl-carrier-protein] synthase family protein [Streptomyces sp. Babs14]
MTHSPETPEVPIRPYQVTAAEVVPGDLLALSPEDATRRRWHVVLHTRPASPEVITFVLRPPLGGVDHEEELRREQRVTVAGRRLDVAAVPLVSSPPLDGVEFRDGDRVVCLRAVDPQAEPVTHVRRWGAWHRDSGEAPEGGATDADVRRWAAEADRAGNVVRHEPRPVREAEPAGVRRVVVTGLGAVSPLGVGTGELWRGLVEGRHGIRELTDEEFDGLPVRIAGTVPVDPAGLLPRQAARRMNRAAQFAVLAAREAWADAGYADGGTRESGLDPERVGVSLGAILGDASVLVGGDRKLREKGPRGVSPLTTPMTVPSQAASQVSLDLHITGEARTVTSACASGTEAIGQAVDRIRYGRVDVALAGGAEAVVTPAIMASFAAMRALAEGDPATGSPSRPFAKDRDGFVNAEGAGILVLESEEHARARGARVYCEAAGWGLSADAHHVAAPDPSGDGIALALRRAVRDAGGRVEDVVHVNAHATATVDGDLAEARALRGVLGRREVPVTALKGHLGHLQGAAGGVEAVAAVLTLHHGTVPPTVGCADVDDAVDLDLVRGAPRALPAAGDLVLSNSFGFGGHNAVLALRRLG